MSTVAEPTRAAAATQAPALLRVAGLNAWYGAAHILFDVDLEVRRGEVVALMGRNGAGKSTTFKAVMGLLAKRRGAVEFMGRDIAGLQPFEIARLGLGFVPEDRRVFTDLTVTGTWRWAASRRGAGRTAAPRRTGSRARCMSCFPTWAPCRTARAGR